MSYFVHKVTKRELLAEASEGASFEVALANYINRSSADLSALAIEGSDVTFVFHAAATPKKTDKS